jgi:hypothetical protein
MGISAEAIAPALAMAEDCVDKTFCPKPNPLSTSSFSKNELGQKQPMQLRWQAVQVGLASSHFFLRFRQGKHPRRDLAPMLKAYRGSTHCHHKGLTPILSTISSNGEGMYI